MKINGFTYESHFNQWHYHADKVYIPARSVEMLMSIPEHDLPKLLTRRDVIMYTTDRGMYDHCDEPLSKVTNAFVAIIKDRLK